MGGSVSSSSTSDDSSSGRGGGRGGGDVVVDVAVSILSDSVATISTALEVSASPATFADRLGSGCSSSSGFHERNHFFSISTHFSSSSVASFPFPFLSLTAMAEERTV